LAEGQIVRKVVGEVRMMSLCRRFWGFAPSSFWKE